MHQQVYSCLQSLREKQPIVHNITNQVVMNNTANALLAIGASPVMAHAPEEVADMVGIASALVINTGTLTRELVSTMKLAIEAANDLGKPWVLDPVGAGATKFRFDANSELMALKPTVLRGNASEIITLLSGSSGGKGVDSVHDSDDTLALLHSKAAEHGMIIACTGATDYIADGQRLAGISNGHPLMSRVTGTGCTSTALTGAFIGSHKDPWLATVAGLSCLGIAGERAATVSKGPGSLQQNLLDQLYHLDEHIIKTHLKLNTELS